MTLESSKPAAPVPRPQNRLLYWFAAALVPEHALFQVADTVAGEAANDRLPARHGTQGERRRAA